MIRNDIEVISEGSSCSGDGGAVVVVVDVVVSSEELSETSRFERTVAQLSWKWGDTLVDNLY